MNSSIYNPDYREVATPWGVEPIVWRYVSRNVRNKTEIQERVADPTNTHVVREVQVLTRLDDEHGLSVDQTLDDLARVDDQFRQLEALTDIRVAPTEWFVFQDQENTTRTLARVAIIDSANLLPTDRHPHAILSGIHTYAKKRTGMRLLDIHSLDQYIFGKPRLKTNDTLAASALYLVDIEPMLRVEAL